MKIGRRSFGHVVSTAAAGALVSMRLNSALLVPDILAQSVALKDIVPKGWSIGAAINQNQSDGRDRVAVDLVARQLNDDGTLRDSPWRRGIGDDYIARAFTFAHEADPNVELYYNDYNLVTKPAKRAGAIRIIKDLQQRGIRIDAVGEQGHWRLDTPTPAEIDRAITELRATGSR